MRRVAIRYRTPFGSFVSEYGAARLAESLCRLGQPTAPQTVYGWLAGAKTPAPSRALAIVRVSAGAVKLEDVFEHRAILSGATGTPPAPARRT